MRALRISLPAIAVIGVVVFGGGIMLSQAFSPDGPPAWKPGNPIVVPPSLSTRATAGKTAFDANCAQCHGTNGAGTDKGPPFINPIYNPGHHGDEAFFRAARNGVRHHHWNFGDMPPQPQVGDADLAAIVAYVREMQVANGIRYEEHGM